MKKLFLLLFAIPFIGFSQQLFWYDVFLQVDLPDVNEVSILVNDFYSNVEKPTDVSVSFSSIPLRGEGFEATHMLSMLSPSSQSLADFRNSLKGKKWDTYIAGMRGKLKSVRAEAGNVLSHVNIDQIGPIGQAWIFKVHAKDVGKFVMAFEKLMKTFKPNGFAATGQITHGTSEGENVFIYATSANLNEAFGGGPTNKKEAEAMQTFFNETAFAEFTQSNTRVEITQF